MPGHGLKNIHTASLLLDSILLLTSLFMLSSCLYLQCSHVFSRAFSVPERVSDSPKGTGLPLPLLSLSRVHKVWSQKSRRVSYIIHLQRDSSFFPIADHTPIYARTVGEFRGRHVPFTQECLYPLADSHCSFLSLFSIFTYSLKMANHSQLGNNTKARQPAQTQASELMFPGGRRISHCLLCHPDYPYSISSS